MPAAGTPGIAVIGLGYVGLPLALSYARSGFRVVGVDVLPGKVSAINAGETSMIEPCDGRPIDELLRDMLDSGRFTATTDYAHASREATSFIVTVGLPVTESGPDERPLLQACRSLARVLKRGDMVLIRSTVVPGTTEGTVLPLLQEESGLLPGKDFRLAYASERIAEGRAFEEFRTIPVALGAIDDPSFQAACDLIRGVTEAEILRSSIRVVEIAKVVENIQRDVNIAIVQEVASLCQSADIDTYELLRVANSHPRVQLLRPGPGVGGYCVPYALHYLLPFAEQTGVSLPLLSLARQVNDQVPRRMVDRLQREMELQGRSLRNARVGVLGLAMKDYSSDDRVSPALEIVRLVLEEGGLVKAYDPEVPLGHPWQVERVQDAVAGADVLILLAIQNEFEHLDWNSLLRNMGPDPFILDTRHFLLNRLDGAPDHHYLGI